MVSTRFHYLSSPLGLFVSFVLLLLQVFWGLDWVLIKMIPALSEMPSWVITLGMYFIVFLFFTYGSHRVMTEFNGEKKTILRRRMIFFFIPFYMRKIPFGSVRTIDFHHPQNGNLADVYSNVMYLTHRMNWGSVARGGLTDSSPYELYLMLQNRDQLLITKGFGRQHMADKGQQLAKLTETRLS
jgi:hypothetical protein